MPFVSEDIWTYNNETMPEILQEISKFSADFGGTDILEPLIKAATINIGDKKRRVFLLTDGEVDDKSQVIAFVHDNCETMRVHSFGIGDGCDKDLI